MLVIPWISIQERHGGDLDWNDNNEGRRKCWVEPTSNSVGLGKGWKIFSDQNKIIHFLILGSHKAFAGNYSSLL